MSALKLIERGNYKPFTRSAGFASALPIVAAMDAAMTFRGRPSLDSAPLLASCNLGRTLLALLLYTADDVRATDLSLNSS